MIGRPRPPGLSRPVGACQNSREGAGLSPVLGHLVSLPRGLPTSGTSDPLVASVRSQPGPSGVQGQWARPGSLTSRRQVAACLEPRTCGARGGGEAGPGPWALLATRARAFPRVPMPYPPPGGDSRSARLFCRLAGGTQGSKARPDWALPGTDARSVCVERFATLEGTFELKIVGEFVVLWLTHF